MTEFMKQSLQSNLMNGSEIGIPADGKNDSQIDDEGTDISKPDYEEVEIATARLKNNKVAMGRPNYSNRVAKD